jgi:hypothetical protein
MVSGSLPSLINIARISWKFVMLPHAVEWNVKYCSYEATTPLLSRTGLRGYV